MSDDVVDAVVAPEGQVLAAEVIGFRRSCSCTIQSIVRGQSMPLRHLELMPVLERTRSCGGFCRASIGP